MNSKLTKLGAVFFVLLVVLIFLSKTIYSYNIPIVTAGMPKAGKLKKEEIISGAVAYKDIIETYFELSGYVDEIFVDQGDKVTKGDALISFRFNEEDLEESRKQLNINRDALGLEIENIHMSIENLNRQIKNLKEDNYTVEEISFYTLEQQKSKIDKAEKEYEKLKTLYEAGAVSSSETDAALYELNSLKTEYENMKKELEKQQKDNQSQYEDKIKDRNQKIEDYGHELTQLNQNLKSKQLEYEKLEIESEKLQNSYSKLNENKIIYAEADGIILDIPVKKGQYISSNQMVVSLGAGNEFTVDLNINLKNNYVAVGDEYTISNSNVKTTGKVTKIQVMEEYKKVTVAVESDQLSQGETVDVRLSKESSTTYTLVPNSAVNKDNDGYFVYYIKKRQGILGEEYYLARNAIVIGDSDNTNTAVVSGISFFEPVLTLSDKKVNVGGTVKVKNEGDFFGN